MVSCNQEEDDRSVTNSQLAEEAVVRVQVDPCCTVKCGFASCSSYSQPCGCTCTGLFTPDCSGGSDPSDDAGEETIEGYPETTDILNNLTGIYTSFGTPHGDLGAQQYEQLRDLFELNNNLIATSGAVNQYYNHVNILEEVYTLLTPAEINVLEDYASTL